MLGKLFLPGVLMLGFFLFTHQPDRPHTASAYVSQACGATAGVKASLAWATPGVGVEQAWVDLGVDPAFGPGWYQAHGPLPPAQNTLSVAALTAGVKYYYRVNTLGGGKWQMIAKGSFVAACVLPVVVARVDAVPVAPVVVEVASGE